MSLKEDLRQKQIKAMKSGDQALLSVMRMLNSAIKNEEIDNKKELTDDEVGAIIKRQVKQLQDALKDFTSGGRGDLVDQTKKEIDILSEYLPEQMSDTDVSEIVKKVITDIGATEQKDIGRVMGAVMQQVSGRADGNVVRQAVAQQLSK